MRNVFTPKLRRLLALALALLLTTALFGCQKQETNGKDDSSEPPAQSDPAVVPTTSAPVEETTEAPTDAPEETTQPEQKPVMGSVTATKLNIRNSDSFDAESVGFYYKDDRVEVLEIKGAWGRTDKGWVSLEYIKLDGEAVQDGGTDATEDKNNDTDTEDEDAADEELITDGETKVLGNGVVTIGSLNVRSGPGTKYGVLTKFSLGNRYAYYQKSGNWVRTDKGWISLTYFYVEGSSGEGAGTGTVTASELNIRTGPGAGFDRAGKYEKGATIKIKAQVNGWGYTDKGWVSMEYVKMDGESTSTGTSAYKTGKGTVTASELNIRKDAKLDAEAVGSYAKGAKIEILEVKGEWGRTDKGWVNMKYVKMDSGSTSTSTYKTGKGTVTASALNIRKDAKLDAETVGSYPKGTKIEILEVKGEWGRTDKGWVNMKYVKMD